MSKTIFCIEILFCYHYFSPLNTFMRKEKDSDPDHCSVHFKVFPIRYPTGTVSVMVCGTVLQKILMIYNENSKRRATGTPNRIRFWLLNLL
jgi:hypothetical protein